MSKVLITESILSGIADAIREKDGSTAKITPANMATQIANIPTGGGGTDDVAAAIVSRTITEYESQSAKNVGIRAFSACSSLTSVSLPACTSVREYAFYSCSGLTSVSLPACTSVGKYAFGDCSSLTSIDLPACTSVGRDAFDACDKLAEIHFAAANQSKIEASSSYSSKWGADNATIYFDL